MLLPLDLQLNDDLDSDFRDLIDYKVEAQIRKEVMNDLMSRVSRGEQVLDCPGDYDKGVTLRLQEYNAQTSRQKYLESEPYKEFRERVWETYQDEAMPPLSEFIPAEEGDDESDDDFAVGGIRQDFKCALTMALLESPMTR